MAIIKEEIDIPDIKVENDTFECSFDDDLPVSNDTIFEPQVLINEEARKNRSPVRRKPRCGCHKWFKKWEKEIKCTGKAICGYNDCEYIGTMLSDMMDHYNICSEDYDVKPFICPVCGTCYADEEKFLTHKETCFKNERGKEGKEEEWNTEMHFVNLKKSVQNEDCIIQPGPNFINNQYWHQKDYRKQHIQTWIASFEKNKYIKCIFQKCYFIAMSFEDMISHFGYCNGDGSFAKFECPHCKGRVTSEEVLLRHIQRSHFSEEQSKVEVVNFCEKPVENQCNDREHEVSTLKSPNNRKKVVLTIKQKLELIEKSEKGEPTSKLSKQYGVGIQTVRDIIKKKAKLEEFTKNCESDLGPSNRKTMKLSSYDDLDTAMLEWVKQKRLEGVSITGPMCAQQAKIFHEELGLKGNFKASSGWLSRFKQRFGIKRRQRQRLKRNVVTVKLS